MSFKTTTVKIPSRGKLNGIGEKVTITEMDLDSELTMVSNQIPTEKIIDIVQGCLRKPKELDVATLPLVDIMYLLFEIRSLSLEKEYAFPIRCEFCEFPFRKYINLPEDLDISYAPDDLKEPFPLELPSGDKIELKSLTGESQIQLEKRAKRLLRERMEHSRNGEGERHDFSMKEILHKLRIEHQIASVNGKAVTRMSVQEFCSTKLSLRNSNAIKDFFAYESFGVDSEIEAVCPDCSMESYHIIHITPEFFRPRRRRKSKNKPRIDTTDS